MTDHTPRKSTPTALADTDTDTKSEEVDAHRVQRFKGYQDIAGFLTITNAPAVFRRLRNLVDYGVRFTTVQTYLGSNSMPDVRSGLTVDPDAYFGRGGFQEHADADHTGFKVAATPGITGFGLGTSWKTEQEVFDYLNEPYARGADGSRSMYGEGTKHWQGITHIALSGGLHEGGPRGSYEHAVITYTNENGVSIRTVVAPDYVDRQERAERDALVLDLAADHLEQDYRTVEAPGLALRKAAAGMRYEQCTLAEHVAAVRAGQDA